MVSSLQSANNDQTAHSVSHSFLVYQLDLVKYVWNVFNPVRGWLNKWIFIL